MGRRVTTRPRRWIALLTALATVATAGVVASEAWGAHASLSGCGGSPLFTCRLTYPSPVSGLPLYYMTGSSTKSSEYLACEFRPKGSPIDDKISYGYGSCHNGITGNKSRYAVVRVQYYFDGSHGRLNMTVWWCNSSGCG